MRILHLRSSGAVLGAENVILQLCEQGRLHGHDCFLALTHDLADGVPAMHELARARGIQSHLLTGRHALDPRAIVKLRALIRELGIDVLHCHGYREDLYAVLSGATRRPCVTTNHLWKRTTRSLRFYAWLDSYLIRRFGRVAAVSREVLDEMRALGLKPPQLVYVPNGVDVNAFAPSDAGADTLADRRRKLDVEPGTVTVTAISSLTFEKGHRYLLRALSQLDGAASRVTALIVGDGPEQSSLVRMADELGIAASVRFLGRREDVAEILSITDIYALPSLKEGFPIALLEAMASGRAVVATDVGDVAEAVRNEDSGMLVAPASAESLAQAIGRLVSDPALRRAMAARARATVVERFSSAAMGRAYLSLYEELLA